MSSAEDNIDIVDRIAQDLPAEVRAAYYRELNHCRSLSENDEMLRILRAMRFLTLPMRDVPERVCAERERLEALFHGAMETIAELKASAESHRSILDRRLAALPQEVAQGIRPEVVAREINESLKQQFAQSTMPQTATAMTAIAIQLQTAVADFGKSARMLNQAHYGAAEKAREGIERLDHTVSNAAHAASHSAEQLSTAFRREMTWSIYTLGSIALVLGIGTGMWFQHWLDPPSDPPAQSRPMLERAPAK